MSDQNPVFIPGPTNIPDRLRVAMQVQTRDHRAPDFVETFAPVLEDTKKVFRTKDGTVITFPSSGTGGWEAAICNTLSHGDTVLVARYGKGHYVYTGLSFFRELPAGVAGAYRLFANIISIGK